MAEKKGGRKSKIVAAILASVTGFSGLLIGSSVIAYDMIFQRYERPDYATVFGEYCYERISARLEREELDFVAGDHTLHGYIYPSGGNAGLIVLAHGFHAGADDYLPMIEYFTKAGFTVFTYDVMGVYSSGGKSVKGMCQSLVDLDLALNYVKGEERFSEMPIYLVGHSWGGYAVTAVLSLHPEVAACAAIAPMNNGYTIMLEKGEQYAGKLAKIPTPIFNTYQRILFGDYVELSGVRGINDSNVPVLIAQGIDDPTITYGEQSIIAHKDEITNPNVSYFETKGVQGDHNNIWHSVEAVLYQKEVASEVKLLEIKKGGKLTADELYELSKTVDHRLYSEPNAELLDEIIKLFKNAEQIGGQ